MAARRHAAADRGCTGYEFTVPGSLSSGGSVYQPDGSYYQSTVSGTHRPAWAVRPAPTSTSTCRSGTVRRGRPSPQGTTSSNDEAFTYSGTAGYYRYRVHAYCGSGSYVLGATTP